MPKNSLERGGVSIGKTIRYDDGDDTVTDLARRLASCIYFDHVHLTFRCMNKRLFTVVGTIFITSHAAHAQLRPLDPFDVRAFSGAKIQADIGGAYYADQRAALAGTEGRLGEIANFHVNLRSGRMIMELGGTVQRLFHDEEVFDGQYADAAPPSPTRNRHDAGDYRVGTVIRLTRENANTLGALRFGTRLPTTDNMTGLDRDATDFYSTLLGVHTSDSFTVAAEAGLGINGTRTTTHEQSDVLLYGVTLSARAQTVTPFAMAVGQEDMHPGGIRGNEDLGEVRIGIRLGSAQPLSIAGVFGYREYSPRWGIQLSGRMTF